MSENKKKDFSRRDFAKVTAASFGAGAFGLFDAPHAGATQSPSHTGTRMPTS
jgi:hypothetical protein